VSVCQRKGSSLGNRSLVCGCVGLARLGQSPEMTLLWDLTEEIQQLHYLSMYLGHREATENCLAEVVAMIPPLVQQEQDHGQDSVTTKVRPETLVQGLRVVRCLTRASSTYCSDHIQILQYGLAVSGVSTWLKSQPSRHQRRRWGWNGGCGPSRFLLLCPLNTFTL